PDATWSGSHRPWIAQPDPRPKAALRGARSRPERARIVQQDCAYGAETSILPLQRGRDVAAGAPRPSESATSFWTSSPAHAQARRKSSWPLHELLVSTCPERSSVWSQALQVPADHLLEKSLPALGPTSPLRALFP